MPKTPRERFETLAWDRVERFEKAAVLLSNCAHPRNYEHTEEEAAEVRRRAQNACYSVMEAFGGVDTPAPEDDAPAAVLEAPAVDGGLLDRLAKELEARMDDPSLDRARHILAMLRVNQ